MVNTMVRVPLFFLCAVAIVLSAASAWSAEPCYAQWLSHQNCGDITKGQRRCSDTRADYDACKKMESAKRSKDPALQLQGTPPSSKNASPSPR